MHRGSPIGWWSVASAATVKAQVSMLEEHSTNCPRNPGLRVLADWKGRGKRFLARRAAWSAWHHVELSPEGTSWPDSAKASLRGNGK